MPIRRRETTDGGHRIELDGHWCRDDFDTVMQVMDILRGGGVAESKARRVIEAIFVEPGEVLQAPNAAQLLIEAVWECCGIDLDGSHADETGEPLFEWEHDEQLIKASLLKEYGISWAQARSQYGYRDLCSLIGLCSMDTPMGRVLYYRTADEPQDASPEQLKRFREARRAFALDSDRQSSDELEKAFQSLRKGK